jgi:MFS family permease
MGIGDGEWGILFGLGPLLAIASILWTGGAVPRKGATVVLRWAMWAVAAGMLGVACSGTSWLTLLLALSLCQVGVAALHLAVQGYVIRLLPREKRRVLSLQLASLGASCILAPPGMEALMAFVRSRDDLSFSWVLFLPFSVFALILFGLSFFYRSAPTPSARREGKVVVSTWSLSSWRIPARLWWFVLLIAFHGVADSTIYIWMPRYLECGALSGEGVSPGWVASGFGLVYLFSRILLSCLPEGAGRRGFLVLPGLLGGSVLLYGVACGSAGSVAICYILGAFLWSTEIPAFTASLGELGKQHFTKAVAVSSAVTMLLTSLASMGVGRYVAQAGTEGLVRVMWVLPTGFLLAGTGGLVWMVMQSRRRRSTGNRLAVAQGGVPR